MRIYKYTPTTSVKHHSFTLIEMLVVIAIIGILASLLFPALNRAISATKTISCANNIRQVSQAFIIYSNDNNGRIPPRYVNTGDYLWTYYLAGKMLDMRYEQSGQYISLLLLVCPEQESNILKANLAWYMSPHYGRNVRLVEFHKVFSSVKRPSQTFLLTDMWRATGSYPPDTTRGYYRWQANASLGSGWGIIASRHNQATITNASFVDCSVKSIVINDPTNPYSSEPFVSSVYDRVYTGK